MKINYLYPYIQNPESLYLLSFFVSLIFNSFIHSTKFMSMATAAEMGSFAGLINFPTFNNNYKLFSRRPPLHYYAPLCKTNKRMSLRHQFTISANLGGGGEGELKKEDKKKFITKEQEPEQYWQTAGEREGENPMSTPLPYIIIFGMSTPFIILAIAFANGWIKAPIR